MKTIKVGAVQCPNCKDIIYSRAHHDCHFCSCGDTMVDGGFEYMRVGFKDADNPPKHVDLMINATKQELYGDWNSGDNRFGTIKNVLTNEKKTSRVKDDDGK